MINPLSTFHRSRLPHVSPVGGTFFVTFRLADALPQHLVLKFRDEYYKEVAALKTMGLSGDELNRRTTLARRKYFGRFEHQLDQRPYGSCILENPACAKILIEQIRKYDGDWYELQAYSIMPNHVHLLLNFVEQIVSEDQSYQNPDLLKSTYVPLCRVLQRIKGASARYINKYLGQTGTLWQKDSYDHWIRHNEKWENFYYYTLNNPFKAGLIEEGEIWPFSYGKYDTVCTADFSRRNAKSAD
ncbi:transposase [Neolewinella agarilytica]|uniref:transposase n=1 Tax=Neolewinella agarilytica TaxID=478744 RepID=UPI00235763B1|nr:transposase [Neolewinella agarilytica]